MLEMVKDEERRRELHSGDHSSNFDSAFQGVQ